MFQRKNKLNINGIVSGDTKKYLNKSIYKEELINQKYLKKNYTSNENKNALIAFQAVNGLKKTGTFDANTCAKFDEYIFQNPYSNETSFFTKGNQIEIPYPINTEANLLLNKFGFCNKTPTISERAISIIKFQETFKIPKTAVLDANTREYLFELGEIDRIIPNTYKTNNKVLKDYAKKYISKIQEDNGLVVNGYLNNETISAIRPILDQEQIKVIRVQKFIHDDFVSTELSNDYHYPDCHLYFNTSEYDYFMIKNSKVRVNDPFCYRSNRNTGEITKISIMEMLNQYDIQAHYSVTNEISKCTFIYCGLIDEKGIINLQVGEKSILVKKQQVLDFICSNIEIPELTSALNNTGNKPIIVFRPDYSVAKSNDIDTYTDLYGTTFSSINSAKFAASITLKYGANKDVFLASDIKQAIAKIDHAVKSEINPQFRIYSPNKTFFKERIGLQIDDYNIVNNLKARGTFKDRIFSIPQSEKPSNVGTDGFSSVPKIIIGHNNLDFQFFLNNYAKKYDENPLFIVSCYNDGNEYFISQLITKKHLSNVVFFTEIIHPTAVSDVMAEYYRMSLLSSNSGKTFRQLWEQSIENVRLKNGLRYSNQMMDELEKLKKIVLILTYNLNFYEPRNHV